MALNNGNTASVLAVIARRGTVTKAQIVAETGLTETQVNDVVRALVKKLDKVRQRAHVSGWIREHHGGHLVVQPVITIGPGANRPKPPPRSRSDRNRAYWTARVNKVREEHPGDLLSVHIRRDYVQLSQRK